MKSVSGKYTIASVATPSFVWKKQLPALSSFLVTCFVMLFAFLLASCKPGTPAGVLSQSEMENVLYDYHLAQGVAECGDGDVEQNRYKYVQAVFQKHGITEAEFDSSMVWYSANSELLLKIYVRLNERFESESKGLGLGVSETEMFANMSAVGDTANIWSGSKMLVLQNNRTNNLRTITINADSTFRPGDNYKLSFSAQFLGDSREAYAFLNVQYKDKTNASVYTRISSSPDIRLDLPQRTDCDDFETEKITVTFFSALNPSQDYSSYLCIMNTALLRIHSKDVGKAADKDSEKSDSLALDSLSTDSLALADSLGTPVKNSLPEQSGDDMDKGVVPKDALPSIKSSKSRAVKRSISER